MLTNENGWMVIV